MKLLLISNSTNAGEAYLEYPMPHIKNFLTAKSMLAAFIPYAGVSINYEDYTSRVRDRFESIGHKVTSVHEVSDPAELIKSADIIVVGGGNTWQLLKTTQEQGLIELVKSEVLKGKPYIGWSAGSNMTCPTIKTTNDMPVVEPKSFSAFNLIPFQINPHYLDANPDGHAGETREARIEEFIELNREIYVLGLREGTMLQVEEGRMVLIGSRPARLFKYNNDPVEYKPGSDLSFLLK
ncbi:MAG: dipeptidase PepE [Bacteroidales bacterium]|nr:dipeptidase PepE [Bacteroidales bacterium]MCF8389649.1 dipeptidase PepE [Bacteroidales bacterium]